MNNIEYNPKRDKTPEIIVSKVWFENNLFAPESDFESMFYEFWKAINRGKKVELKGIKDQLKVLKNLMCSGQDLYMVSIQTRNLTSENSQSLGQKVLLVNEEFFLDISSCWWIFNLGGHQVLPLDPPYVDFIHDLIEEILPLLNPSNN